ncbi:alpha/beta fold hydrolase [Parafilimonas terrae]|uniref:Pimeloyl-ACP methyl ester carboxylesterase n=1 Tax=Parafilimonas terrae TaxID=1465490 RepID=A0A1I5R579_9BACT|nr:alpha/beta hydrolase [Parafilimonas terrae]SFP53605.1 Pimeloyl-ACP methyl ester carboxylesterase [Parafilimonas terrae]
MYKLKIFAVIIVTLLAVACNNNGKKSSAVNDTTATNNNTAVEIKPATPPSNFKSITANVNGINIHYVMGGSGEPLLLIHGFGQNWYMWNRLLPELSKHFTVIAPDLPGLGESDKPDSGYTKKQLAQDLHALMQQIGFKNEYVVGHDIGLMVAYAYAAQFGDEVIKVALLDALLPGVEPVWTKVRAEAWWFGFFGWPASAEIVEGKEKEFLTNFWNVVGHKQNAFTKDEVNEFVRAYSTPKSTYGAFHWFAAFSQDALDNQQFMQHKLKMPLLAMSGEFSAASYFTSHCKLVADNVTGSIIKGSGHWLVQENTEQVQHDLLTFLLAK